MHLNKNYTTTPADKSQALHRALLGFLDHFPGIGKTQFRDFVARDHCRQSADPCIQIKGVDLGIGPAVADLLADKQLIVRKGGHLRGVGDAEHLVPGGGLVQQLADPPGSPAGNADGAAVFDSISCK